MPPLPIRHVLPGELPPACLERGRARTYRMMTCWDGPRYPAFNSYDSRLRSFAKRIWPHPESSPVSFAAAGLFYTGKDLCVSLLNHSHIYSITVPSTLLYHLITGHADETRCFHCGGGVRGWLGDENDPWREHLKRFPNSVYVRFLMDGKELRPAFAAGGDDSNVSRHWCTIV